MQISYGVRQIVFPEIIIQGFAVRIRLVVLRALFSKKYGLLCRNRFDQIILLPIGHLRELLRSYVVRERVGPIKLLPAELFPTNSFLHPKRRVPLTLEELKHELTLRIRTKLFGTRTVLVLNLSNQAARFLANLRYELNRFDSLGLFSRCNWRNRSGVRRNRRFRRDDHRLTGELFGLSRGVRIRGINYFAVINEFRFDIRCARHD